MKKELIKTTVILKVLAVVFLFCANSFSQDLPTKLILNTAQPAEIKGGEKQVYSVDLAENQTARVEIVQDGVDVSLTAYNLNGEEFIITESPSGFFGNDLILVTAKEAGAYKIEVTPADPNAKSGKYSIVLKEIRPTVVQDFEINEASRKILTLAENATKAKYDGTVQGQRQAIVIWDEAIAVSKIKQDKVWEGIALVAQGLIYGQLGELQNALDAYLKSLEIWLEVKNKQYEGSAVNNIGIIYSDLGENEKAISYYEQAIKIQRESGDILSVGVYLNNIAHSYLMLGKYDKAEDFFRQSLEIKRTDTRIRGQRSLAITLNNLGKSFVLKGNFNKGIDFLQQSLELRRKVEHHWGVANSLLNLGKAQWDFGQKDAGFKNLTEANLKSNELGDRRLEAESFYLLAVAENDLGNIGKAIENVSKGLEIIEQIRGELVGSQSRYTYFSTVQNYYELYTDLLVSNFEKTKDKSFIAKSLQISEQSRSRSLIELLQEAKINFKQRIPVELLEELKTSQDELNNKFNARQNLLNGTPKPEQIAAINEKIIELNTEIQSLQTRIRRENPKYSDLTEGKTITANEIQKLLDDKTVLLEYKLGEKRSFLWIVSRNSIEIFNLPPRRRIEEKARRFYDLIVENNKDNQDEMLDLSDELSSMLLSPAATRIKGKRIAIVADGVLQFMPFPALQNPNSAEKVLADDSATIVLPSASVLAQLRENTKNIEPQNNKIAIFADPVFDQTDSRISGNSKVEKLELSSNLSEVKRDFNFGNSLPRLLFSRQEARSIQLLSNNDQTVVKMDFDASVQNLETSDISQYRILHFATHGFLNTARPEFSGLVLSLFDKNGRQQDGFLSLNDIYNLELSSDLVVLSACQTALGKEVRGEGLIGLSRGFLYAGSKKVIASLWKVDDAATAEFMKLFYRNHLGKKLPASTSLQQAKLEMKKIPRYKSPYYWSAFTLLGDWQ